VYLVGYRFSLFPIGTISYARLWVLTYLNSLLLYKTQRGWRTLELVYFGQLFVFPPLMGKQLPSGPGPPHYRGFTVTLRHTTLGRTALEEWSARLRYPDPTTHNTQNIHYASGGIRTRNSSRRSKTWALDRVATGIGVGHLQGHLQLVTYRVTYSWSLTVGHLHRPECRSAE